MNKKPSASGADAISFFVGLALIIFMLGLAVAGVAIFIGLHFISKVW